MIKKIILIFLLFYLYGFTQSYKISFDVECEEKTLLETVGIASFKFITGNEEFNEFKILDEKGNECEIVNVNYLDNEIELIFKTTNSQKYSIFAGDSKEKKNFSKNFKKGFVLIDDYIYPDAKKSGVWKWEKGNFSGVYLITNEPGFSFQRVTFNQQYPINFNDKIIFYLYIEEKNPPDEIMIELISRYRRHYYYYFGKDKINIKSIKKEKLKEIPEIGKWVKIEIPLDKIKEKNIEGIGFYKDKGKIYIDRISLNEVPVEMKIKKVEFLEDKFYPFFTYQVKGPFKFKDKRFAFINLDASLIKCEKYVWEIDGKIFTGDRIKTKIETSKKDLDIKLIVTRNKVDSKLNHKIKLEEDVEIKFYFDILPFSNFIYQKETVFVPIRIENMSYLPFDINLKCQQVDNEIFLFPGKENGLILHIPISSENEEKIEISAYGEKLYEKIIKFNGPLDKNYKIDGPFMKEGEKYLVFKIPDYSSEQKVLLSSKNIIIGDLPDELIKLFNESGKNFNFFKTPIVRFENYLLSEFQFIQNIVKEINNNDLVLFFPFLNSLLRRHNVNDWLKVYDCMLFLITQKTKNLVVFSPFPSYPDLYTFEVYKNSLKALCEKRNIFFFDLYDVFTRIEDGEKFFKKNKYVYTNFPNKEGCKFLFEMIMKIFNNEKQEEKKSLNY